MHLDDYQAAALRTASNDPDRERELLIKSIAWAGEVGEFCEMIADRVEPGEDEDKALLIHAAVLAGAMGEFFNKLKKRVGHGHAIDDAELVEELRAGIRRAEALVAHLNDDTAADEVAGRAARKPSDDDLKDELGDGLWYLAVLAALNGHSLADVAETNVEKLRKRYPDGFSREQSINRTV